jgi:CubicO group peptidase (beta-lactamase class C family)
MKKLMRLIALLGGPFLCPLAAAQPVPAGTWPTTTPLQSGWSPGLIEQARSFGEQVGTAAFMVVQHGKVVVSFGATDQRLDLHSMRKSLLSALIGIAVADGALKLDSTLADLHVDDNWPSLTEAEKRATIRDLIGSRSGVYHAALYETDSQRATRPARGSHEHGAFWYYNNWDFNTLGAIYERAVGLSIFQALQAKIAAPIGMQDFRPADGYYVTGYEHTHGSFSLPSQMRAYPLRMTARDLARFGLLFLHNGAWGSRQVVPAGWVADSTKPRSDTSSQSGYGYMWWTGQPPEGPAPRLDLPRGGYWASGHFGQAIIIDPADDMVIVHLTNGSSVSTRQIGHLVWLVLSAAHSANAGADPLMPALPPNG